MNQPIPSVMQVMDPHSQTAGGTQQLREAFIRKKRKKFGVLPNPGGGVPPNQNISGFFLRERTFSALK